MSRQYKSVSNGNGTDLTISSNHYFSIGKNGTDIMLRCGDEVLAFDTFQDMVDAIDKSRCAYYKKDNTFRDAVLIVVREIAPEWEGNEEFLQNVENLYDNEYESCYEDDGAPTMIFGFYKDAIVDAVNASVSDYEEDYLNC